MVLLRLEIKRTLRTRKGIRSKYPVITRSNLMPMINAKRMSATPVSPPSRPISVIKRINRKRENKRRAIPYTDRITETFLHLNNFLIRLADLQNASYSFNHLLGLYCRQAITSLTLRAPCTRSLRNKKGGLI